MKIYPYKNNEGKLQSFEIENLRITRKGVVRIVEKIPGAVVIKTPKFLSWFREDVFCKFKLGTREFHAEEPFGDNSRYLIYSEPPEWSPELEIVSEAFSGNSQFGI